MKKNITLLVVFSFLLILMSYIVNICAVANNTQLPLPPYTPPQTNQNREYIYNIQLQFKDSEVTLQQGAKYRFELIRFDCFNKGAHIGIWNKKELKRMTKEDKLTYVSNNSEIAKVSSDGVMIAANTGKTVIDIYYKEAPHLESGDDGYAKTSIAVIVTNNKVSLSKRNLKIKIGKKRTLKLRKYPDNVINKTTYKVSKKRIVKIKKVSENRLEIIGKKKGSIVLSINVLSRKFKCRIYVK